MLFVVNKPRLQRIIAIVREDRSRAKNPEIPYLRIKAEGTELTISGGGCVTATFPATVYESGVLFIYPTNFRRVLRATKIKGDFITFQVTDKELVFADARYQFENLNMIFYPNPESAPENWPPPPPEAEQLTKVEKLKAMYRHKTNGQIFAIETDEYGSVVSTAGPLLCKDLNPNVLKYDKHYNSNVKLNFTDYVPLSKLEYAELLNKNGFFIQGSQRTFFDQLNRRKPPEAK